MRNKWTESFLQESDDLLASIEECALAVSSGETTEDTVDRLFRAFHTIKGTGAMCGLDQVAGFAHHVESLLDDVREHRVVLRAELADLFLASVDQIKILLAAELTDPPQQVVVDQKLIARIQAASAPHELAAEPRAEQTSVAEENIEREWEITFRPNPEILACGGNPILLFEELRELGEVEIVAHTEAISPLEQLQVFTCGFAWTIRLRTTANENAIRDVFIFVEDGAELSINPAPSTAAKDETAQAEQKGEKVAPSAQNASARSAANAARHSFKESMVRVPAARLDRLVNLVGELVMNQSRLAQVAQSVGLPEIANPVQEMDRLVAELRDDVLGIRMLPIGSIFGRFRRLVHDLSVELGKEVVLETEGEETELDKSILDQLGDPLVHMIRNSVDHGIESPQKRIEQGKPARGTVRLAALHRGSDVVVSVSDDGGGINRAAVRAKAVSRGMISADAELSDRDLLNLILLPGFSTSQSVTNISGRGVGMDVVKKQIEALRGSLSIVSEEGKGTTMSLSLPLTLAIIEGLIVQVGEDQFIIPMAAITENVELDRAQRARNNRRNVITVRGELVPYIDLRAAFDIEGSRPEIEKVVIVRHDEGRVGLVVDLILGNHQTVLQSLGHFFRNIDVVSGATILGDGRVALIFDIAAVVRYVEKQKNKLNAECAEQV